MTWAKGLLGTILAIHLYKWSKLSGRDGFLHKVINGCSINKYADLAIDSNGPFFSFPREIWANTVENWPWPFNGFQMSRNPIPQANESNSLNRDSYKVAKVSPWVLPHPGIADIISSYSKGIVRHYFLNSAWRKSCYLAWLVIPFMKSWLMKLGILEHLIHKISAYWACYAVSRDPEESNPKKPLAAILWVE